MRWLMVTGLMFSFLPTIARSQVQSKPLSNDDVIQMMSLGISDDVVIEKIRSAPTTNFDTSIDGLRALKAAKVSDAVLKFMINPHRTAAEVDSGRVPDESTKQLQPRPSDLRKTDRDAVDTAVGGGGSALTFDTVSKSRIQAAIARGKQFRSRAQYLDVAMKEQKYQISSAWAADGISKYLLFFTDYDVIAAAAAAANQQMRELTDSELHTLRISGLVLVIVQLHARRQFPLERLQKKFTGDNLHLVLQIGNNILQPIARSDLQNTGELPPSGPVIMRSWTTGNTSLITTERLGFSEEREEVEFAFKLPVATIREKTRAILLDGDGKHYEKEVDLPKLLHEDR